MMSVVMSMSTMVSSMAGRFLRGNILLHLLGTFRPTWTYLWRLKLRNATLRMAPSFASSFPTTASHMTPIASVVMVRDGAGPSGSGAA